MSKSVMVNLDLQVEKLLQRWRELDSKLMVTFDKEDRTKIKRAMGNVQKRWHTLSKIKIERKASEVVVEGVTEQEKATIKKAMADLSLVIQREETVDNILVIVAQILKSADTIIKATDEYQVVS